MKLLFFLGNPGVQYKNTRHNLGFLVGDILAQSWGCSARSKDKYGQALVTRAQINNLSVLLVKPESFMNLSGKSVRYFFDFYKCKLEDIVVVCDDLDLAEGVLRMRHRGSAGGHNGLKSIIQQLGSEEFTRIKIGIGRPENSHQDIAQYVLSTISSQLSDQLVPLTKEIEKLLLEHFFAT